MKLVRFGPPGHEKPGIIDSAGGIRDLSSVVADIAGDALTPEDLAKIRDQKIDQLPKVTGNPRLGPCVGQVRHYIAIGLNYADHAAEAGQPLQKEPIITNFDLRSERRHHHAERIHQARLRDRTRDRDWKARPIS